MDDLDNEDFDLLREDITAQRDGVGLENEELLQDAARGGGLYLGGLAKAVVRAARLLRLVDRALRLSQPPGAGKIGVRWWKMRGQERMRMPVLVTWHPVHGGRRWRAKALRQVRRDWIGRKGTATVCADETFDLALAAAALIRQYGTLRKDLESEARRLKKCHEAATDELDRINAVVVSRHRLTVEKLLNAGYNVDDAMRDLPNRYLLD